MESPSSSSSSSYQHHDVASSSRPSLGFPLGTALLLLVIFSLSGIFSCCYHWDKLRRTLNLDHPQNADDDDLEQPTKPSLPPHMKKENESLTVIMPGDNVPKFIAMPCPPCYALPTAEESHANILVQSLQEQPPLKPAPRIALPLYV